MTLKEKLWKEFSQFIRLRDSDENGYCKCFTCHRIKFWKDMDCGHGIPRQHKATYLDEKNNHAQCKHCNGFEGGKREVYRERVNKRYGPQTWDLLLLKSRQPCKVGKFEEEVLLKHYQAEVIKLKNSKHLAA